MKSASDIVIVSCNGFIELLQHESHEFSHHDDVEDLVASFMYDIEDDNGVFILSNVELEYEEGEMGEYGRWDISPGHWIHNATVTKVADVFNFKTRRERKADTARIRGKRVDNLQKWVSSFNTESENYFIGSTFGTDVFFGTKSGESMVMYTRTHSFGSIVPTIDNVKMVMDWVSKWLMENRGIDTAPKQITSTTINDEGLPF